MEFKMKTLAKVQGRTEELLGDSSVKVSAFGPEKFGQNHLGLL